MNTRIKELAVKSGFELEDGGHLMLHHLYVTNRLEKFAELIVQECIKQAHSVGNLRGANDDMIYGADTAAVQISKHFGVE